MTSTVLSTLGAALVKPALKKTLLFLCSNIYNTYFRAFYTNNIFHINRTHLCKLMTSTVLSTLGAALVKPALKKTLKDFDLSISLHCFNKGYVSFTNKLPFSSSAPIFTIPTLGRFTP